MKNRTKQIIFSVVFAGILLTGCGASKKEAAEDANEAAANITEAVSDLSDKIASEDEQTTKIEVVEEGMVPVPAASIKDGTYAVTVDSSSSMFKIFSCDLTVADGQMTAVMKFEGNSYTKVFPGTAMEAAAAAEDAMIPASAVEEGFYTFTIPVDALDQGIDCAAFSRRKEKWYERTLVFRADSLPLEAFEDGMIHTAKSLSLEDGSYYAQITLGGGSGRAKIESPTKLEIKDGQVTALIQWGSANYDYMKVDGEKYLQTNTEGNSTFEIPIKAFDWNLPVIADTIAMSEPHEIEYTLHLDSSTLVKAE